MKIEDNDRINFVLAAYERCFDSKHHYDSLSWVIGGILFVFVGALFAYLPQVKGDVYHWVIIKRMIIAVFSWILLILWYLIYERNRFWAEVANEKIRDFEREFQIEGVGIKFMKANKNRYVIFENTDEKGQRVENERKEDLKKTSLHSIIPLFLWSIGITILVACIIP